GPAHAQAPDSTGLARDSVVLPALAPPALADSARSPSPRGALVRALVAPGLGQIYVGQPVKTPFVVGALGGLVGLTIYLNGRYVTYRHAFLYVSRETNPDPTTPNPANEFVEFYDDWIATGARAASTTRSLRDDFRRNRDLALLGSALVYALQALDAYVAAHLTEFDVSADLSLRAVPTADGPVAILTVRF
ncbi:MAG: hypothetical protein HKN04_08200, partial [Rhodothermaceae bacterium]|nr:hypothetical protein [Rhodothermaceae bacterium]